jgi:hypothetical protein
MNFENSIFFMETNESARKRLNLTSKLGKKMNFESSKVFMEPNESARKDLNLTGKKVKLRYFFIKTDERA